MPKPYSILQLLGLVAILAAVALGVGPVAAIGLAGLILLGLGVAAEYRATPPVPTPTGPWPL